MVQQPVTFGNQLEHLIAEAEARIGTIQNFDERLTAIDIEVRNALEHALQRHDNRMAGLMQSLQQRHHQLRLDAQSIRPPPIEQRYSNPRFLARANGNGHHPPARASGGRRCLVGGDCSC